MKLILLLIVCVSCFKFGASEKPAHALCENKEEIRSCPKPDTKLFLPRTYPARSLYIGYSSDEVHTEFLKLIIDQVQSLEFKPMINILVPRTEDIEAHKALQKYFDHKNFDFINLIPTTSNETVWAQDYMEILFDTKTGFSKIVDLPYAGREGESIPVSVALSCQKQIIEQRDYTQEDMPGNGDYGGNIEAISEKILLVGNNLSNESFDIIQNITSQELVEVDVNWLETGHVDELFTTLPNKKEAKACEQTLLVASPGRAYEVLDGLPKDLKEEKSRFEGYYDDYNVWPVRHQCLYPKNFKTKECIELRNANNVYQMNIEGSVQKIEAAFEKLHGCKLSIERFPQLFIPVNTFSVYGTYNDRAVALNPNSVNNIFFYPKLILAKQEFLPFQKSIEAVLKNFSYEVIYADGKFVHELNGGIHCATNISYGCSP